MKEECKERFSFSMSTKKAAANSLYIILFSQITSLFSYIVQRNIPSFSWGILALTSIIPLSFVYNLR